MSEAVRSRFIEAKRNWLEAADRARTEKDTAREQYNEAIEMGLTQDNFDDRLSANNVSTL